MIWLVRIVLPFFLLWPIQVVAETPKGNGWLGQVETAMEDVEAMALVLEYVEKYIHPKPGPIVMGELGIDVVDPKLLMVEVVTDNVHYIFLIQDRKIWGVHAVPTVDEDCSQ